MQPDENGNYWESNQNQEILDSHDNSSDKEPQEYENAIHWQTTEYISQEKDHFWYISFGLILVLLFLINFIILKDITFYALVVVMAVSIVIFSKRKPKMINCTLTTTQGLYIDNKLYHFNDYKAFGLLKEGERHTFVLLPTKRFSPSISVYFDVADGEKIVNILGHCLPMVELKFDIIDIIIQKIRL